MLSEKLPPKYNERLTAMADANNMTTTEAAFGFWCRHIDQNNPPLHECRSYQLPPVVRSFPAVDAPLLNFPLFRDVPFKHLEDKTRTSWYGSLAIFDDGIPFDICPMKLAAGTDIAVSWSSLSTKIRHKRGANAPRHMSRSSLKSFSLAAVERAGSGRTGAAVWASDFARVFAVLDISRTKFDWLHRWFEVFDAIARLVDSDFKDAPLGPVFHHAHFEAAVDFRDSCVRFDVKPEMRDSPIKTYRIPLWRPADVSAVDTVREDKVYFEPFDEPESRVEFEPFPEPEEGPSEADLPSGGGGEP